MPMQLQRRPSVVEEPYVRTHTILTDDNDPPTTLIRQKELSLLDGCLYNYGGDETSPRCNNISAIIMCPD